MSASSIKKLILILIALVLTAGLASCSSAPGNNTVTVPALTYAEYAAASDEAKVVIEGYLQSYALVYGDTRVSMFLQDDDGAYYVYLAVCDAEKANQLEIGKLIRVTGVKGSYAGESEVQEQSTFEILSGSKIYDPADITSLLGSEPTLEKMMNRRVCLKGLVIRESYGKDDASCAYLYNCFVYLTRPVFWKHNTMYTSTLASSYQTAQIVWVGNSITKQNKWLLLSLLCNV